jgi:hypothetical protein
VNCADCREAMMEYALGSLPSDEAGGVRTHLDGGCAPCQRALREAREVLGLLPYALAPVPPPTAVKARISSSIAALPPARGDRAIVRPRRWLPLLWAASIVATATIVGSLHRSRESESQNQATVVFNAQIAERDRQVQAMKQDAVERSQRLTTVENSLAATNQALARLQQDAAAKEARAVALEKTLRSAQESLAMLRAANLKMVTLGAQGPQPVDAHARVLWDQDRGMWQIVASGMRPPKPGRTFEVWCITSDQRKIAAGTFDIDDHGNADAMFHLPPGIEDIAVAAITDEPIGGVQAPTGEIHLAAAMK